MKKYKLSINKIIEIKIHYHLCGIISESINIAKLLIIKMPPGTVLSGQGWISNLLHPPLSPSASIAEQQASSE